MELSDWKVLDMTKKVLSRIERDRLLQLESVVNSDNKDFQCGIVEGYRRILDLLKNAEVEEDL